MPAMFALLVSTLAANVTLVFVVADLLSPRSSAQAGASAAAARNGEITTPARLAA